VTNNNKWLAISGVAMGVFMATLDASIVNISLPTLIEYFDTSFATIQWVVLSYGLVVTSLILSFARLGDMRNKKPIYLSGMMLFTISSLLCALAPRVEWLIGFRALQGLGATMMQALGMAIITEVFPARERGMALGITGAVVSTGIAIGPPLGGILISAFGWQSVFLVNIPIGIIAALVVLRFIPDLVPHNPHQRFDVPGAAVLLVLLSCYALGMTTGQAQGFGSSATLAMLGMAGVLLAALLWIENHSPHPMIDLKIFKTRLFGVSLMMGFLVFIVLAGGFVMPFFLELVLGLSTGTAGWLLMAQPVAMGVVAPLAGSLSDRYGSRLISLIGLVVIVIGCILMSTLHADVTPLGFLLRIAPLGLGMGMFQSPNNSAVMGSVQRERLGIASGLLVLSRTLGQSTGLPLFGALFTMLTLSAAGLPAGTEVTGAPAAALVTGLTGSFRIAAVVVGLSAVLAFFAFRTSQADRKTAAAEQAAIPPAQAGE